MLAFAGYRDSTSLKKMIQSYSRIKHTLTAEYQTQIVEVFFGVLDDELVHTGACRGITGQKKHGYGDMFGIDGDIVGG